MCGICGTVARESAETEAVVDRMVEALAHRGPHNQQHDRFGAARLGHTRLSILDLSSAANQPMVSATGRFALTYNGEIYNFQELREELEKEGASFRTRSDTEVLLAGFERWGANLFPRLNGIFALGIWDTEAERLHLVRDRFGVKPLYYARSEGALVFASELTSLRAGLGSRGISEQGLLEYLWLGNPHVPHTLYEGVFQVEPGHHMVLEDGELRSSPYWEMPAGGDLVVAPGEAAERVRALLDEAVRRQLVSDVPVGIFLSGGIDSSALALLAARHSSDPLASYFVRFDFQSGRDERELARKVAALAGTRHEELFVEAAGLEDTIAALLRAHGQPFGDPADIPLFLLCRELGGRTRVVLQGDGGDELFAGYHRYDLYRRRAFWRAAHALSRGWLPPLARSRKGQAFLRMADAIDGDRPREIALLLTSSTLRNPPTRVLTEPWRRRLEGLDPFRRYREVWPAAEGADPVQQMLHADARILLGDYFLQKVDRSTMAWGVEVRVPFLDNDLADYALALPSSLKQRGGTHKWILKQALRGTVPDEILDQPKQGFGVPIESWIRGPLKSWFLELIHDPAVSRAGVLDAGAIERLLQEDASGRRFHAPLLWKLLLLALWTVEARP